MHKSYAAAVNLLAAGALMLGTSLAQNTPATTQTTQAPSSAATPASSAPAKAPAAKAHSATAASAAAPLALKTQKEKFSYAMGMRMGESFKKQSVPVDPTILARGLKDALAGSKTLLTEEEAQAAVNAQKEELQKTMEAKRQTEGQENKKAGQDFLAANKSKDGVVALLDGLQYKILKAGNGPKPTASDSVSVNYRGTLINGTEFDSSYKRGQPATFPVSRVIKGWTEALQLMPVGSKWQLFIPSDLAYGDRGRGADIGPSETLIFEVELLSIESKKDQEKK